MTTVRKRGEYVRRFLLDHLERHPKDVVRFTAQKCGISRQAVNRHLKNLIAEKAVVAFGATRRTYRLAALSEWQQAYPSPTLLSEDAVWREVSPHLGQLPDNVRAIWVYGFTAMFNNVIDHSAAKRATVKMVRTAVATEMMIVDDGVGIFRKIQEALHLLDERHAVLELA